MDRRIKVFWVIKFKGGLGDLKEHSLQPQRGSCRSFSCSSAIYVHPVKRIPYGEGSVTVVMVDRCYSYLDKTLNFTSLE